MAFASTGIEECIGYIHIQRTDFGWIGWTDDFISKISTMPLIRLN